MPGYQQSYVNDFTGSSLPSGWGTFNGTPGSDPGTSWAPSHVVVSGGLLQLNAYQDSKYNNEWVTGGVCQCGVAQTYGAYFVRSKLTGAGPTQVELLWPTSGWPPEIDFNETYGDTSGSMATLHYDSSNDQTQQTVSIDMTQWHTWGVIWTPTSVTYTVDGNVWGSVTVASEIPSQPMTLDIQQQAWCSSGFACPTSDQSTEVDWVAEYTAGSSSPVTTTTQASAPVTTTTTRSHPVTTTTQASATVTTTTTRSNPVTTTTQAVAPVTTTTPSDPATTTQTSATVTTTNGSSPAPHELAALRPFASDSAALTSNVKSQISRLAKVILGANDSKVTLVGFSDAMSSQSKAIAVSKERAASVAKYLKRQLARLSAKKVKISVVGEGSAHPIASNTSSSGRALNRRVVISVG
jgi:outer membrane protein OmpA-like peptidoglycan-associated protein